MRNLTIALTVVIMAVGFVSVAGAATETFDSGFTGAPIGNHADWGPAGAGPTATAGSGVAGSVGLPDHGNIFTWTAHPFDWSDANLLSYTAAMDFKTDGSGRFDDDRIGWMINMPTTSSSNIMSVQMDPGGSGSSGYNIECYYDGVGGADKRPSIVDLPVLPANAWYRLEATFTKTAVAIEPIIGVDLQLLDAAGNPSGSVASGSLATSSLVAGDRPNAKYFSGDVFPSYKNYNHGFADNASFEIAAVPEPTTIVMVIMGLFGMAVCAWRKRSC